MLSLITEDSACNNGENCIQCRRMKKSLACLFALAAPVLAEDWFDSWLDDTSAMAQELCNNWRHELPETGIMPSFASVEFTSTMGERHGGSSLSWQQYGLCLPLADPRRSGGEEWMFNASFNAEVTVMNTTGDMALRRNDLYHFSLPVSAIIPHKQGNYFVAAVSPSLASDFVHRAHSFHLNFLFSYSVKHSDTFSYSIGLAHSPDATIAKVMPVFSFDWQMSPEWSMKLSGFKFSVMRDMGNGLSLGLFAKGAGGSWAVDTPMGTRMLRVRSLVAGVTGEYDFSSPGQTKRIITLSVGSTLTTAVDLCRYNDDMDREWGHHYHPGLYVSGGVDFRF